MSEMRRGCIAIGTIKCDMCGNNMEHGKRYLLIEDEKDESIKTRYCIDCCLSNGYADYVVEKGERVLTFFADHPTS